MSAILAALPADLPQAMIVVQHRHPDMEHSLAHALCGKCRLSVSEVLDKEELRPGHVHVAPANYHLLVERDGSFSLSVDPKVHHSRPSIDVLFESAARFFGPRLVGVVLTGANDDGAAGLAAIKRAGGLTIVQDPADAAFPAMPRAAIAVAEPDLVLTLAEIAALLSNLPGGVPLSKWTYSL